METPESLANPSTSTSNLAESKVLDEPTIECKLGEEFFEAKQNLSDYSDEDEQDTEDSFFDTDPVDFFESLLQPQAEHEPEQEASNTNQSETQPESELNPIDRLIDQRRNEVALELRRLQFSSRTATRNRLEQWFTSNSVQTPNTNPTQAPNRRVYRSTNIQEEISQLGSIQRVTNVLSTSRTQIENVLRNMLQPNSAPARPSVPPPAPPHPIRTTRPIVATEATTAIEQISREQIIGEISELVHRQLVSSSLQSEFRSVLERRVMDRLRRIGTDGAQTRDFIRNLPSNPGVQRNDFSNIGINMNRAVDAELHDALDEPRVQRTVAHNSREIKELKNEIGELKNMLKLSFELQLDMQRSLKQEISALISGTFQNNASANLVNFSRPLNSGKCVICIEADSDTVFYQCGHICACYSCSMTLKQKDHNCPVCRAPIKDIIRSYKCSV